MLAFRLLVLRRLRQAPWRAATVVLTVGAGVALAVSITVLVASITTSLDDHARSLAGPAPLRITGATSRGGIPAGAAEAAAQVDGVAAAVPVVQVVGRTQSAPGATLDPVLVLGVDCSIEAVLGAIGCDPTVLASLPGALAVGPSVEAGPDALLRTDAGPLPLAAAPVADVLGDLGDGATVLLPLPVAQATFMRTGRVDVVYLLPEPGADLRGVQDAVQAAVGEHLPVVRSTEDVGGAANVLGGVLPIYSLLGIFGLGIGGVLVSNTAAMSLESRRRELAVLGALGARPRTVLVATVAEMGLLGAAGGLLGSFGGVVVARPIVDSMSTGVQRAIGASVSVHVPPSAFATGLLLGSLLGAGAALWPTRRALRLDVAAELSGRSEGDSRRPARLGRRALLWSALGWIGVAGCWTAQRDGGLERWQAAVVNPAFVLVTIGGLFAAAASAPLLVARLTGPSGRVASAPVRLAVAAARRDHRRTGLLAVTVGAAVVTAFVTEGSSASARASIESSFARLGEGVDVATAPPDARTDAGLGPDLLASLATVPGVGAVQRGTAVVVGRGEEAVLVKAVEQNPLEIDVVDGVASPERLEAGEVMIGTGLARRRQIRAGDRVTVATPTGPVELPVQGVWHDGDFVGSNITMSYERLEALFGPQPSGFVSARPAPGVSEAQLSESVRAAALHPELVVRSSDTVADDIADAVDLQFAAFRVMQRALLAVLFVAVLSSLLLAGVQRRQELGLLGAVGADPRLLARLLLTEAGIVALAGIAASAVLGPVMLFVLNQILPFIVGFKNEISFDWIVLATASAVALVVVLVGAAWPARRAARVEVLEALRYE